MTLNLLVQSHHQFLVTLAHSAAIVTAGNCRCGLQAHERHKQQQEVKQIFLHFAYGFYEYFIGLPIFGKIIKNIGNEP